MKRLCVVAGGPSAADTIGELTGDSKKKVQTQSICAEGEIIENIKFPLDNTLSKRVVNTGICAYPAAVLKEFEARNHDWDHTVTMARLVRILRDGEYDRSTGAITLWEPPLA